MPGYQEPVNLLLARARAMSKIMRRVGRRVQSGLPEFRTGEISAVLSGQILAYDEDLKVLYFTTFTDEWGLPEETAEKLVNAHVTPEIALEFEKAHFLHVPGIDGDEQRTILASRDSLESREREV